MHGFLRYFGSNIVASGVIAGISAVVALVFAIDAHHKGRAVLRPTSRILAVGSAAAIVAATLLPLRWPGRFFTGDLELTPFHGTLAFWQQSLSRFPDTLPSVLLVVNLAIYVPLGVFVVLGWGTGLRSILACVLLSLTVETAQYAIVGGHAETDDIILNTLGALTGVFIAAVVRRLAPHAPS